MSGWRATVPTERLFGDPRFLRLEESEQNMLLRLYARCDRWGRGPAHPRVLAMHLMVLRADARTDLDALAAAGLVTVYTVAGDDFYEIADYDADAMRDTLRKRGPSNYPAPPTAQGQTEAGQTADSGQSQGRPGPAQGQSETGPRAESGQTDHPVRAESGQSQPGPTADLGRQDEQKTPVESAHARARGPAPAADSIAEHSRAEQSTSTARAQPPGPARMGAHAREGQTSRPLPPRIDWPGPLSEEASDRYLAALTQHGHAGGPPATVTPEGLAALAREYGDAAFAAGCDAAIAEGPTWPGWKNGWPLRWLDKLVANARHRLASPPRQPSRERERKRPPTYADLEEGAQLSDASPPRAPGRPPTYADLEAERGGVA